MWSTTGDNADPRVIAAVCQTGECPTIYGGDDGGVVVQGYTTRAECPDGESAVWIPWELLRRAAEQSDDEETRRLEAR